VSGRSRTRNRNEQILLGERVPSPDSFHVKIRIRRLTLAELLADTIALAQFLIGKVVVRDHPAGRMSGRIVETEAYPPGDPAGHHYRGPTARNRSLFLRHGHCYVYFTYGNHFMLNVSSEGDDVGGGVLIRALEPLQGIETMRRHRQTQKLTELTRGPGRLAAALQIDRRHDGIDLCERGPLWLGALVSGKARSARRPGRTVRIGITKATDRLFRFYERGNPYVSGPKRLLAPKAQR
jgi:DNA-3-methyladenine glycosylase